MNVVGLFAGIGGIEYGLHENGHNTVHLCEIMPEAQSVLRNHFNDAQFSQDVCSMQELPQSDMLTAGFPCQNLSIAGDKKGLAGEKSSLLFQIFRLLDNSAYLPDYILIENVANLISLNKGEALSLIIQKVREHGYDWAYRLVDPRSFGIPQRRPRFIFLASRISHPKYILFPRGENFEAEIDDKPRLDGENLSDAYGFYWTEGKIGIGWANNSIPPLKCGSTLGLPSSPAIWDVRNNFFGTPTINDAERLQGFPENWTEFLNGEFKDNKRWKLIGNAVNTRVSEWVARRIDEYVPYEIPQDRILRASKSKWHKAGFNDGDRVFGIKASFYPNDIFYVPILTFINHPLIPLSLKATLGFRKRVMESTLIKYPQRFKDSLNTYLSNQYDYAD